MNSTKKSKALLAYLVVEPGEAQLRDKLAALLWGDSSDQRARHSLRQTLLALKQALPGDGIDVLRLDAENVAVDRGNVELDVAVFEQLAAEGTPQALARAAALYQGDFLEGLGVQEPRFEEWLVGERERLREVALETMAKLLAHQTNSGTLREAIQTAGRLLRLDPLQEAVHRALMRLYARQGRRGAALRQYQICVAVLQRELAVEPEPHAPSTSTSATSATTASSASGARRPTTSSPSPAASRRRMERAVSWLQRSSRQRCRRRPKPPRSAWVTVLARDVAMPSFSTLPCSDARCRWRRCAGCVRKPGAAGPGSASCWARPASARVG